MHDPPPQYRLWHLLAAMTGVCLGLAILRFWMAGGLALVFVAAAFLVYQQRGFFPRLAFLVRGLSLLCLVCAAGALGFVMLHVSGGLAPGFLCLGLGFWALTSRRFHIADASLCVGLVLGIIVAYFWWDSAFDDPRMWEFTMFALFLYIASLPAPLALGAFVGYFALPEWNQGKPEE
jgi:hypothetical protein